MGRKIHVCLSVRGALHNRHYGGFKNDDGTDASDYEAEEFLMDQLVLGREKIPFGEPCEGFSYITGCPGHEEPDRK